MALNTLSEIADRIEASRLEVPAGVITWLRSHTTADLAEVNAEIAFAVLHHLAAELGTQVRGSLVQAVVIRWPKGAVLLLVRQIIEANGDRLRQLETYLTRAPRSLAISLAEAYPSAPEELRGVVARVVSAQRGQTNPGVLGHEWDDLSIIRRTG